jgi:glycosyltransferase involved in cell wall biosynthesis
MKTKEANLIVVSSYPEKGLVHGIKTVGVASYAKNTLLYLSKAFGEKINITVLAEKLPRQENFYKEKNITVNRCWQRNRWTSWYQIFKEIKKQNSKKILFEFEMAMMGDPSKNILLPLFLLILKLSGKKVYVVIHQVVLNFEEMSGHLGIKNKSLKNKALSIFSRLFFSLTVYLSFMTIVFEQFLKDRLAKISSKKKIVVIPHGVEKDRLMINKEKARKKLGYQNSDFIMAIFGYLAWYKGTDWLAEIVSEKIKTNPQTNIRLIIAGGPNPNHKNKSFYQKYLKNLETIAKKHPEISITGFVDQKDITAYYQAADVMVYPYRTGMSSSGPLAMAFTNHKPFLVSEPLSQLLDTADIINEMRKSELKKNDLSFSLDEKSFWTKIENLQNNKQLAKKLSLLSEKIAQKRSWKNIGLMYKKLIYEDK